MGFLDSTINLGKRAMNFVDRRVGFIAANEAIQKTASVHAGIARNTQRALSDAGMDMAEREQAISKAISHYKIEGIDQKEEFGKVARKLKNGLIDKFNTTEEGLDDTLNGIANAYEHSTGSAIEQMTKGTGGAWDSTKEYFAPGGNVDWVRAGLGYAAGNVALRTIRGGSAFTNPEGERDIAGLPFV